MKNLSIAPAYALLFVIASCSQEGPSDPGGSAGTSGSGGSSPTTGGSSSGGSATTGGSATGGSATGGSSSGGAAPASGGTATAGSAGTTEMGGSAGAAPSGGSGGAAPSGGAGGATAGSGGASKGGAAGNSAGGSGGSGGSGELTPAAIIPTLDGFLFVGKCSGTKSDSLDCTINGLNGMCDRDNATWANRGAFINATHAVGGTTGTKYFINFEVRGVTGGKFYTGGEPLASTPYTDSGYNTGWKVGGTPTETLWNTYEVHVDPPVPGEANVYYLNAFPVASAFDGKHQTFAMKFSAKFAVLGGGTVKLVIHDSNCAGQQNCGQTVTGQSMCSAPRKIDLTGMSPQPAAPFPDPYTQDGFNPQWLFFDVKSITTQ